MLHFGTSVLSTFLRGSVLCTVPRVAPSLTLTYQMPVGASSHNGLKYLQKLPKALGLGGREEREQDPKIKTYLRITGIASLRGKIYYRDSAIAPLKARYPSVTLLQKLDFCGSSCCFLLFSESVLVRPESYDCVLTE